MIENKVVIITGASSGIGEAKAKLLASKGAKVVLGARCRWAGSLSSSRRHATGGQREHRGSRERGVRQTRRYLLERWGYA
jgi:NAD(P)-dependent dehydrogenase (short-subunit alcohol dehydrogenase family)